MRPGDHLLSLLRKEVQQLTAKCTKQRKCPFCPFRSSRLNKHVRQYHTAAQQYVASGAKQLKLCCALYDQDQTLGVATGQYLARSAEILRSTVQPGLPKTINEVDREIRLVLTGTGPEFWMLSSLSRSNAIRRVRNLYYTKDFADLVFREMLLCHGKCKAATWIALSIDCLASCENIAQDVK